MKLSKMKHIKTSLPTITDWLLGNHMHSGSRSSMVKQKEMSSLRLCADCDLAGRALTGKMMVLKRNST